MRCISVEPGKKNSAKLEEWRPPPALLETVLVQTRAVGVCGTDAEILRGEYGEAPQGEHRLIIGHEAVGQVLEAPPNSGFAPGDYVVPLVRWPDSVPCLSCAAGEWDMCRNGQFTEHGIKFVMALLPNDSVSLPTVSCL
jgi:threonine dehydrogenase-like Zn-dependent dehydrogenase